MLGKEETGATMPEVISYSFDNFVRPFERKNAAEMIGRTHLGHGYLTIHTYCPLFKPEPHARIMKKDGLEGEGCHGPSLFPFPMWPHWINPCQHVLTYLFDDSFVGGYLCPIIRTTGAPVSYPNNLETTHIDLIGKSQIRLGSLAIAAEVHYLATLLAFYCMNIQVSIVYEPFIKCPFMRTNGKGISSYSWESFSG